MKKIVALKQNIQDGQKLYRKGHEMEHCNDKLKQRKFTGFEPVTLSVKGSGGRKTVTEFPPFKFTISVG